MSSPPFSTYARDPCASHLVRSTTSRDSSAPTGSVYYYTNEFDAYRCAKWLKDHAYWNVRVEDHDPTEMMVFSGEGAKHLTFMEGFF